MASTQPSAVTRGRKRRRLEGFARVELQVRREDVTLVREIAKALADPEREDETRTFLRKKIGDKRSKGFKELLASAPLDGIDLERSRDFGRDAEL